MIPMTRKIVCRPNQDHPRHHRLLLLMQIIIANILWEFDDPRGLRGSIMVLQPSFPILVSAQVRLAGGAADDVHVYVMCGGVVR